MSIICPGCKCEITSGSQADTVTETICPECNMTFIPGKSPQTSVLEPGTQLGGYEIVRLIGSGGMGKVYEAIQLSLQRKVALKVIEAELAGSDVMVKRFLQEVRATASLEHPNIVTVFEASQEENLLYLAMELVDGVSLDSLLKATRGAIDEVEAWNYALQVCDAMNYAWKYQQLLHRDIKPANIMVLKDGRIKICDLGIAKRGTDEVDLSREGMAIGTPHYMSPEQGQGLSNLDFRTDLYSLGASLFHLTTGRVPYPGINAITVITSHIVDELADPRVINSDLSIPGAKLITLMMGKKPKDRHPSWEALRADIEHVLRGEMPSFEPEPPKSGSSSIIPNEVIVPANEARKGKRTMVDLNLVRNELALNAQRNDMARGGWQLVRVGYLTLILVVLIAFVAFQYRSVFLPDASAISNTTGPPVLQLDDGTDPAPPETIDDRMASYNSQRTAIFDAALKQLSTGHGEDEDGVGAAVEFVKKANEDILSLSRYCASQKRFEEAVRLNTYVLATPDNVSPLELGIACMDLIDYLRASGNVGEIPNALQAAVNLADKMPDTYAAAAHIGYAEHYWESGNPSLGCDVLADGFTRFTAGNRVRAAEMVAVCLIRYAQYMKDEALLNSTCDTVRKHLPEACDAVKFANSCQKLSGQN